MQIISVLSISFFIFFLGIGLNRINWSKIYYFSPTYFAIILKELSQFWQIPFTISLFILIQFFKLHIDSQERERKLNSLNKIVLLHVPNTFNYGSSMMGINFIYYFSSTVNKNIVYVVDLFTGEDLNRLNYETLNKSIIKKFNIPTDIIGLKKLEKVLRIIKLIIYSSKDILSFNPIGIVILGGDDVSEYGSIRGLIYNLYQLYRISKKSNVFLLGQTIGPFHSWRKQLARFCLRNCQIFTRDPLSANYLKDSLKLKNVLVSSDLAFLDLPRQKDLDNAKKLLKKYEITSNDYITLIPSGLIKKYTNSYTDYLKTWIKIVNSIVELPALKSKKIVLLAHVLRPEDADDRKIINEIKNELPNEVSNRMVYITDVLLPSEARIILGNGIFTITGRMHGAISTFQMLKPAISLSYSVKYKGVISESLGMNDLIIEARSGILWSSGKIVELVMEKVEYVLRNYDEIIKRIEPAVDKNKKMAMAQIECVAKNLEGLMK